MPHKNPDCREAFLRAIRKAAQDNPELAPKSAESVNTDEDIFDMLATMTADGEGGLLVFLAGREFAGKVLENIPNPESFEVCALVRDAVDMCISTKDNVGTLSCQNFYTLSCIEDMLAAGVQFEPPTYTCSLSHGGLLADEVQAGGVTLRSDGPSRVDFDGIDNASSGWVSVQITDSSNGLVAHMGYYSELYGRPFTFYRADGHHATLNFPASDKNFIL